MSAGWAGQNRPERTTLEGRQAQRSGPNSRYHRKVGCPGTIEGDSQEGLTPSQDQLPDTRGFVGRPPEEAGEHPRAGKVDQERAGRLRVQPGVPPILSLKSLLDGPRRPPLQGGRVPTETGAGLTVTENLARPPGRRRRAQCRTTAPACPLCFCPPIHTLRAHLV